MSDIEPNYPVQQDTNSPRPEKKATMRLGARELARISASVVIVISLALIFAGYRVFKNFKSQRDIVIAKENLHKLYTALSVYSMDTNSHFPKAESWTDAAMGYLSAPPGTPGGKESFLHGPGDGEDVGYVFNDLMSEYNLDSATRDDKKKSVDLGETPLLIEVVGAKPNQHMAIPEQSNDQGKAVLAKLAAFSHYSSDPDNATTVVLFANGKVLVFTHRDLVP